MSSASHEHTRVGVVRTGTANLASVLAGLERVGLSPQLVSDPGLVQELPFVVLPGVGAFRAAREELERLELVDALRTRIERDLPTLCVCLGMQLLCESSTESPDVSGLGVVPGRIERFPETVRVPQLGWNRIEVTRNSRLLDGIPDGAHFYFVHSYAVGLTVNTVASSNYGKAFTAITRRNNFVGTQFHPERSGEHGARLLQNFLQLDDSGF